MGRHTRNDGATSARSLQAAVCVALAVTAATGCHGGVHSQHAVAVRAHTSASPSTDASPRAGVQKRKGLVVFSSPSKNIQCLLDDDPQDPSVRCDVLAHSWDAAGHAPKDCVGDYGNTLSIGPTKGMFVCASDAIGDAPVLPYGAAYQVGHDRCLSTVKGMRCVDLRNGHGFLVSRQSVRLF